MIFTTAIGIIALIGLVEAKAKKDRTLIIGGGVAGIHMGYRLQQRGESTEIWEMSDVLGGKAKVQYEDEGGATLDIGGVFFPTIAYRECFKLFKELGLKNLDDMKRYTNGLNIDPAAACYFANDFNKCDSAMISDEQYTAPIPLLLSSLSRGMLLMQEEGYFGQFVQQTTLLGYDWTSPTFDLGSLAVQTIVNELELYGQLLDTYTDNAYSNPDDLSNPFNKYGFPMNTEATKEYLNQTILEFLRENNMFFFRALAEYYHERQGYGLFEDTPLYYFAMWFSPQLVQLVIKVVTQSRLPEEFDGWTYLIKRGVAGLLNLMVVEADLNVLFQRKVTEVKSVDGGNSFKVYFEQIEYKNGEKKVTNGVERFDRVISGMSSQEFVQIYNKGQEISQPFLCRHASTWAVNLITVTDTTPAVNNAFDNKFAIFSGEDLEDPVVGFVFADILRLKDATDVSLNNEDRPVQAFYDFPFRKMSRRCDSDSEISSSSSASRSSKSSKSEKVSKSEKSSKSGKSGKKKKNMEKSKESMSYCPQVFDQRMQLDDVFDEKLLGNAILESLEDTGITEAYFPHSKDLYECNPWEVNNLQGNNGLYFIGGTVNFESVEHIIRYNNYIIDMHF